MFIISAEFEPLKYLFPISSNLTAYTTKGLVVTLCVCNFSGLHDTYDTFFDIVSHV